MCSLCAGHTPAHEAAALGARSAVGSTYSHAAPRHHEIWKAVDSGNLAQARAGMARVCRIIDILGH